MQFNQTNRNAGDVRNLYGGADRFYAEGKQVTEQEFERLASLRFVRDGESSRSSKLCNDGVWEHTLVEPHDE